MTSSLEARALRQPSGAEPIAQRMKFLCPNCKTKYQIAEEKVAERSVKINCRNCGFLIRIAQLSPGVPASPGAGFVLPKPAHVARGAATGASEAGASAAPGRTDAARSLAPGLASSSHPAGRRMSSPMAAADRTGSRVVQDGASVRPLPRPAGSNPSVAGAPRTSLRASPRRLTQSGAHQPVAPPRPGQPTRHSLAARPDAGRSERSPIKPGPSVRVASPAIAERGPRTSQDALAGAFAKAVDRTPSTSPESLAAGYEWWVGINDTPTGPLKLSELRLKAALHIVGPDSLVWREGFEDWAPVKKFPELLAIVEEASSATRMSRPSPLPASDLLRRVQEPAAAVGPTIAAAPSADAAVPAASGEAPAAGPAIGSPQATAAAVGLLGKSGPTAPTGATDLAGVSGGAEQNAAAGLVGLSGLSGPAATPAVGQVAGTAVPDWEVEHIPGLTRGRPIPAAAWVAVVAAVFFGLTLGFVMFGGGGGETAAQAPVAEARPNDPQPKAVAKSIPAPDTEAETTDEEPAAATGNASDSARKPRSGSNAPAKESSSSGAQEPSGSGLTGLRELAAAAKKTSGPKATSSVLGSSDRGHGLDSDTLTRTVSRYKSSVSRSCWQPALDTRDRDAPSSARVSVTIQVASSGKVQSVKTTGDPNGYRGLARCIESRVRGWRFPASGGSTTVNVPFVFTAQ